VATRPDRMDEQWRVAMFALTNMFLKTYRLFSQEDQLSPTAILICSTVAVANVQKLMRERTVPAEYAGTQLLPREWVVPISRSAIAAATGLPRETVRRQVAQLVAQGRLAEDPRGGITAPSGFLAQECCAAALEPLMTDFARTAEALLRAGVIEAQERPQQPATTIAPRLRVVSQTVAG
jgi:hypothetical protein